MVLIGKDDVRNGSLRYGWVNQCAVVALDEIFEFEILRNTLSGSDHVRVHGLAQSESASYPSILNEAI